MHTYSCRPLALHPTQATVTRGHVPPRNPLEYPSTIPPTPPCPLAPPNTSTPIVSLTFDALAPPAGQFTEAQQGEVKFPEINARVLEKTVQYFYYKLRHTNHGGPLPEFKIEPETALELLMAANYLDT